MNKTEFLAKLVRAENLNPLYNAAENQKTISCSRLVKILDSIADLQKQMVHEYQVETAVDDTRFYLPAIADANLKIDDYVFACRWPDASPSDPWILGSVSQILGETIKVRTDSGFDPNTWRHAIKISPEVAKSIFENYPRLEGQVISPYQISLFFSTCPQRTTNATIPAANENKDS